MPSSGDDYDPKAHQQWLERQKAKIRLRYPNLTKNEMERVMRKKKLRY